MILKSYTLFLAGIVFFMFSCKTEKPQPDELVGEYLVTIDVPEDKKGDNMKDESRFFDSFSVNLKESWDEWADTLSIKYDTTTIDGKLEYTTRMFGESMKEFGNQLGGFMENLGDFMKDFSENAGEWKNNLLKNLKFRVELQADGDLQLKEGVGGLFSLRDAKWKIEKDSFFVMKSDSTLYSLHVLERDASHLVLQKDELIIRMQKQSEAKHK